MVLDVDTIKARRDWRIGKDLSPTELRLDDECLAHHYAEDVTLLLGEVERLRRELGEWKSIAGDLWNELHNCGEANWGLMAETFVNEYERMAGLVSDDDG